ncbi:protein phosphatase 1 [Ochromonadaceae sp. CCMP2298]|nr:protein phosphatase 1 [Ochromonadaceae sp. CCMP2298]
MAQKVEVQVIEDKLLLEGVLDEKLVKENDLSRINGEYNLVELAPTVQSLSLSFKRIGRIENLVGFDNLVKLCLDNNFIEEIRSIGHLINLRWLDLSFNKIKKIEGLDNLTQLEDLSLYSNKISVIEGLETCSNLQCLSLGNNRIDSLEQIIKFRQLKSLRMLTLSDNPISTNNPDYRNYVMAYVDTLKYLDYALIDPVLREKAQNDCHDELVDIIEKESVIAEKAARESAMEVYLKKLEAACVLFAHTIFDDLFAEDSDVERLKHMPGVKEQIEQFRTGFKNVSEEYIRVSLEKYEKKRTEVSDFDRAVRDLRSKDDLDSTRLIDGFNKSKKDCADKITHPASSLTQLDCMKMVKGLQDELDQVCDELMNIELRQVEKFESLIDDFENRLNDLKNEALESQQLFFRTIEDLEEKFSVGVRGVATDLIDRLAREELAEDYLDEEAMGLVIDKDTCMGVLSASHDMHIGRILKREDEARGSETKRFQETMAQYLNEESARNRDRVLQVHDFSRQSKASLHALLSADDEDGMEEDEIISPVAVHHK